MDAVHAERLDAVVVPLTTNLTIQRFGDHTLMDWTSAGLPRPSMAKGIIETVARSTFDGQLGRLTERDMLAVEASLREVLGLRQDEAAFGPTA